jgi:hypothetical protein
MKVKNRTQAAEYIDKLLTDEVSPAQCCNHFGRQHLRMLMDFIYGGKPTRKSQRIKGGE